MANKSNTYLRMNGRILCQAQAPVKTANLQQNGIQSRETYNGVIIFIDPNIAKYGEYLDDGKVSGKGQEHTGWWSEGAYNAVTSWVEADFNGSSSALRSSRKIVGMNSRNTLARQVEYTRNIRRTGL